MTVEEFIESSIEWNKIVGTQDIITQKAIVKQEAKELKEAVNDREIALEQADVIWTNAWLREIAGSQALIHAAQVSHTEIKALARIADPKALEAVSKSNWSKLMTGDQSQSLGASEVARLNADPRYKDVRVEARGKWFVLIGTDMGDGKRKPIEGKILKPSIYTPAEELY